MKKKAVQQKQGAIARFCSAQEKKARISLILAAAVVVTTFGSVCTAAILLNSDTTVVPDDIVELNAAEQYLASAALQAATTETDGTDLTAGTEETGAVVNLSGEPRETKRGGLTGEHVVDISNLQSLSDKDLVDAIVSGKAGVIARKDISTDQSQNENAGHKASVASGPAATNTPSPVPTNVPTPTMAPITTVNFELGIDISEWQQDINWSKVKAAGIEFAFIRCGGRGTTKGGIYEDKKFLQNIAGAQKAGIKVGVYFFSQAITPYEALEEASFTISRIRESGRSLDLPVVMDWESERGDRTYNLKGQDFTNVIISFCSTIAQNGYTPMVYLDSNNITNRPGGYSSEILSRYKLWYAYPYAVYRPSSSTYIHNFYQAGDSVPPRNYSYSYWQYSWWGKVPGIPGDVDMNIRILGSTTLGVPEINLPNSSFTSCAGQAVDPLEGVSAKTSQDINTTSGITYVITNEAGQTVTLEQAQQTVGKYKITYSYTDSLRGKVTNTASWEVTAAPTDTPTPTPGGEVSDTPSPTPGGEASDTPSPTPEGGSSDTPTPTPEGTSDQGGDNGSGGNSEEAI